MPKTVHRISAWPLNAELIPGRTGGWSADEYRRVLKSKSGARLPVYLDAAHPFDLAAREEYATPVEVRLD